MTKVLDVASQPQLAEILRSIDQGAEVILTRDGRKIAGVNRWREAPSKNQKKEFLDLAQDKNTIWRMISMPNCQIRSGWGKNKDSR